MDFVSGLPQSHKGYDLVWVIVDHLTNSTHVLPVMVIYRFTKAGRNLC